jgi:protein involved in polysaccharide export with SLBB domain
MWQRQFLEGWLRLLGSTSATPRVMKREMDWASNYLAMRVGMLLPLLLLTGLCAAEQVPGGFDASILGEVHCQGRYHFTPGSTVMDLWLASGGATSKTDLRAAILIHDGREIALDLSPSKVEGLRRMKLAGGDVLVVSRGLRVAVSGEVLKRGVYTISRRSSSPLQDAIEAAGGTTGMAALGRVLLVRRGLSPIVFAIGDKQRVPGLQDGDIITVPAQSCVVLGAVTRQGALPLTGQETLIDVISQSGALRANLKQVVVVRAADLAAGTDSKEVYDLRRC